jgi:transcriptional regulator
MLILRTLELGPAHGFAIALSLEQRSDEVLLIEEGSLYPALHRLEDRDWIASEWGVSDNNRRARFYRLTARGRRQLATESSRWKQLAEAIARVMAPAS